MRKWTERMLRTVMILLIVGAIASSLTAQGRRGGGGGGGGGGNTSQMRPDANPQRRVMMAAMRAFPVAQMWAEVSLGLSLDDEKLAEIKPHFVDAYTLRRALLKEAREEDTWSYAKGQLEKADRELWSKVSSFLSRRQRRTLERAVRQR